MTVINATGSVILDTYNAAYYGAALSIFAGLCVVYTYATVPALHVQPNSILVAKSVFDMLLGVMIVIEYVPFVNTTVESNLQSWRDCGGDFYNPQTGELEHNDHSWAATFLTQWFFTLSLLCFGIISLDFLINSSNPFANMRKNNMRYGIGVMLVSLLPPSIMVARIDEKTGAGRWILGFCFTKWAANTGNQTAGVLQSYNWRVWAVNIAVIVILLLFTVAVTLFFCKQNQLKARARGKLYGEEDKFMDEVLNTTINCVVAFLVFWIINAALYVALYVVVEINPSQEEEGGMTATVLASIFAFVFSAQGFVLLPFWFRGSCCAREGASSANVLVIKEQLANALSCHCFRNFAKGKKYENTPTTNSALRKEIVTYLSNGIQLLIKPPAEFALKTPTFTKIRLLITDDGEDTDEGTVTRQSSSSSSTSFSSTSTCSLVTEVALVPTNSRETLTNVSSSNDLDAGLPSTVEEEEERVNADLLEAGQRTSEPEERTQTSSAGRARNKDHVHYVKLNERGGCVVTEMWPRQMAAVRAAMFDDPRVYHKSLASISAAKLSGGKSDAFMFKTDDKRFVLKTMSAGEFKQLGRMMMVPSSRHHHSSAGENDLNGSSTRGDHDQDQDVDLVRTALVGKDETPGDGRVAFWQYMIDNPSSFIVKIFGVYKMTLSRFGSLNEGVKQYFIVMQNVFYDSDTSARMASIQETYDLKGSTVARSASPLKDGTVAICRFCRLEYTVGEKRNVPTPQPGDFVQLLRDRAQGDDPASSIIDEYDVCTGILQRQLPGGRWRVKWPIRRPTLETRSPGLQSSGLPSKPASSHSIHPLEELCWTDGTQLEASQAAKCKINRRHEPVQVFKDNDLKYKIVVDPRKKFTVGHQLRQDSSFLARHNIMDYSLLLGVHRSQFLRTRANKWPVPLVRMPAPRHAPYLRDVGGGGGGASSAAANGADSLASTATASTSGVWTFDAKATGMSPRMDDVPEMSAEVGVLDGRAAAQLLEGPTKFYFGIIDILQRWNNSKKMERFCKKLLCCAVGQALSATEPRSYKHRFDRFMNEQVFDTANSKANIVLQSNDMAFAWVLEIPNAIAHLEEAECLEAVTRFAIRHAAKECGVPTDSIQLDAGSVSVCISSLISGQFLNEIPIMTFSYGGGPEGSQTNSPVKAVTVAYESSESKE